MRNILLLSVLVFGLSSCKNLVYYTDSMKAQYGWNEDQLRKIQFYLSNDIVLRRELSQGSTEIVSGKIKTVNGKRVEEILIRERTPGILTQMPRENKMLVSFEISDSHYLSFGVNPNMGDKYVLLAESWNGNVGTVNYHGNKYYTQSDSKYSTLLVDLRKIQKLKMKQRVAKGRKVN